MEISDPLDHNDINEKETKNIEWLDFEKIEYDQKILIGKGGSA